MLVTVLLTPDGPEPLVPTLLPDGAVAEPAPDERARVPMTLKVTVKDSLLGFVKFQSSGSGGFSSSKYVVDTYAVAVIPVRSHSGISDKTNAIVFKRGSCDSVRSPRVSEGLS